MPSYTNPSIPKFYTRPVVDEDGGLFGKLKVGFTDTLKAIGEEVTDSATLGFSAKVDAEKNRFLAKFGLGGVDEEAENTVYNRDPAISATPESLGGPTAATGATTMHPVLLGGIALLIVAFAWRLVK